jgi:uncharacterized membrane protein
MSSMSFREKRAVIGLVALGIVGIACAAGLWLFPPVNPFMALPGVILAFILLTGIMTVSHIALMIAVGLKEAQRPSDERERLVQLASQRNAGLVATIGLWGIPFFMLNPTPRLMVIYAALGFFLLGLIVQYASELFYYRRGV